MADGMMRYRTKTWLSTTFFSEANLATIQAGLRVRVKQKANLKITDQDPQAVRQIQTMIFEQTGANSMEFSTPFLNQRGLLRLNEIVIEECANNVIKNIAGQNHYNSELERLSGGQTISNPIVDYAYKEDIIPSQVYFKDGAFYESFK